MDIASVSYGFDCTLDHRTMKGSFQELHVSDENIVKFAQYVKAWANPELLNCVGKIGCQKSILVQAFRDVVKIVR